MSELTKGNTTFFDHRVAAKIDERLADEMAAKVGKGVFSFKELRAQMSAGDSPECEIEMLRTGTYLRNFFWFQQVIGITEEHIDNMIKNFNDKVCSEDIQLDTSHNRDESYGWLKSLSKTYREVDGKNECFMVGNWSLTPDGARLVREQIYKYFSLEFAHNYSKRALKEVTTLPSGEKVPTGESTRTYGPTITGGALTNRPFIPNLKQLSYKFSENNTENELPEFFSMEEKSVTDTSSGAGRRVVNPAENRGSEKSRSESSSERVPEPSKTSSVRPVSIFARVDLNPRKGSEQMNLTNLKKVISGMESELSSLTSGSAEHAKLSENITALKQDLKEAEEMSAKNRDLESSQKDLTTKVVSMESTLKETQAEVAIQKERARQSGIAEFCNSLATEKSFTKPVVDRVRSALVGDKSNGAVVASFTDGDKKQDMTLKDVMLFVLDGIPQSQRVPTGEAFAGKTPPLPPQEQDKKSDTQADEAFAQAVKEQNDKMKRDGGQSSVRSQAADPVVATPVAAH